MEQEKLISMKEKFTSLLRQTERVGVEDLLEWLETTDFYTAPASTRFHGNYEGGLLEHSLNVFQALFLIETNVCNFLKFLIPYETVVITALLHDVCKANTYKKSQRWRKDQNNRWEQYDVFEFNEDEPLGHGEKSVFLIQRAGMKLTKDEVYMIRWHMGGFEAQGNNQLALTNAMQKCPGISLIHAADMIATSIIENENLKNKDESSEDGDADEE